MENKRRRGTEMVRVGGRRLRKEDKELNERKRS
jgi:hypothetical protein